MTIDFNMFRKRNLNVRELRKLEEWEKIDKLCDRNLRISYIKRKLNHEGLPIEYEIIYKIRSFIGVKEPVEVTLNIDGKEVTKKVREPIYGDVHKMKIILPNNFPSALGNPQLYFITDVWHPNIRYSGEQKGRVCSNEKDLGVQTSLADRIYRIGQYLQYQLYHALDNYPYPEDRNVAEWIREEAEPMNWVNKDKGIFTDDSNLKELDKSPKNNDIFVSKDPISQAAGKNILKI
jgi:hypothetical protein